MAHSEFTSYSDFTTQSDFYGTGEYLNVSMKVLVNPRDPPY